MGVTSSQKVSAKFIYFFEQSDKERAVFEQPRADLICARVVADRNTPRELPRDLFP
jgi:hypothetical protein